MHRIVHRGNAKPLSTADGVNQSPLPRGLVCIGPPTDRLDVRSLDAVLNNPEAVLRRVISRVQRGSIILLHDAGQPVASIEIVLNGLIRHAERMNIHL